MDHDDTNLLANCLGGWPPEVWRDVHVVLAVSGGCDSVAMLRAAVAAKQVAGGEGRLYAAHLDHGLRGIDAAADAAWVADLCRRLEVPMEAGRVDVAAMAADQGDGWESAARAARYDFLRVTAERLGARFVAVAHTADDQIETVLHRLIRGTGLAGLAGMPFTRPLSPTVSLVRPLLGVRRAEVRQYLAALGQDFREDATNVDCRFTRNRIRQKLLPLLRDDFNANVEPAVLRLVQQAAEAQRVVAEQARALAERCVARTPSLDTNDPAVLMRIACGPLAGEPAIVVREMLKTAWTDAGLPLQDMGFDQWQQLGTMAMGGGNRETVTFPGNIRVERTSEALIFCR